MKKKTWKILIAAAASMTMILSACGQGTGDTKPETKQETENTQTQSEDTQAASEAVDSESASGEVAMSDGYYFENTTGLTSFYRFNDNGTYYAKFFEGGVIDAGTYQVLDESAEYSADAGADDNWDTVEDNTKATANQVVEVTSYKDGSVQKLPYADDKLCDINLGGMSTHKTLTHKGDYPYNPATDEIPLEIALFYANESIGSTLNLSHNQSFMDATGDTLLEGTWVMDSVGQYTLTYDESGDTAVLAVAEDGKTATLTPASGEPLELKASLDDENTPVLTLSADAQQVGLPMPVGIRLDCLPDGTCKLIVSVAEVNAELEADKGTYTVSETYEYTFNFEKAGTITGTPDYTTATQTSLDISAAYKGDVTVEFSGSQTPLSIDSTLTGTYSIQ